MSKPDSTYLGVAEWSQLVASTKLANALRWFEKEGWKAYNDDEIWGKNREQTNYQLMAKAIVQYIHDTEAYFDEVDLGNLRKRNKNEASK